MLCVINVFFHCSPAANEDSLPAGGAQCTEKNMRPPSPPVCEGLPSAGSPWIHVRNISQAIWTCT